MKKIFKFIVFLIFIVAIIAFVLYFRGLLTIKGLPSDKVTNIMEISLVRYRNIGVFCLALGVFLIFLKTLFEYFSIDNDIELRNESVLDRISSRTVENNINYSFNENNIINDLLSDKSLKVIFHDSLLNDRLVRFKNYDKDKNTIEFYDLTNDDIYKKEEKKVISEPIVNEYIVNKEPKYDKKHFTTCPMCDNVVAKDAAMCVHCGTMFKEVEKVTEIREVKEEKTYTFNPIKFVLNMIVILFCIILILLCFNKISSRAKLIKNNFNISTIQKNINR